jgi:peptide/nickel transport system substrate-binding protein
MMTLLLSRIRFAGCAVLVAAAGCGKQSASRPAGHALPQPPLAAKSEPGQRGGRFVIALAGNPQTFNPLFAFDGASDAITRLLFGSLVNLDLVNHEPGPGLAEAWSVEPDNKTWTFKLRHGLRWSDGMPLTAADVAFTWNEVMYNPQYNHFTYELFRIHGQNFTVTNLDETTVRVVTPEIFAPLVEFFGSVAILPRHALGPAARDGRFPRAYAVSTNTRPEKIIGSGPYRVKDVQPGKSILLEANPEYWVTDKQGRRLPYFDEVIFPLTGRTNESATFLNGRSDACDTVRPEQIAQFKQASASGRFRLLELGVGTERDFIWFNQNTGTNADGKPIVNPTRLKWFLNKKFRQAVSCALDRERMAREAYEGSAQPIYGFLSTENPKWNNPKIARFNYDPARAKRLLGEIGIQDRKGNGMLEDAEGNPIEILFNSNTGNPMREKAALMIQEDLKKIGISLTYVRVDFRTLLEKVNTTFDYECALMGLGGGGVDPASQLNVLRSSDELHQWFPFQKAPATDWEARVDALMESQMRSLDFAQRKKDFDEVQAILAEELPMIYTVSPFTCAAIRSDVGNTRPSVLTPYRVTWNIEELYFKKP